MLLNAYILKVLSCFMYSFYLCFIFYISCGFMRYYAAVMGSTSFLLVNQHHALLPQK